MFEIDLLKGRGIPPRTRPEGIVAAAVTFVVPVIATVAMLGLFLTNSIRIRTQRSQLANYERQTAKLSEALESKRAFEQQKQTINRFLSEVSSALNRHTQWSDILVTVVENMPESMILTGLEVKQNTIKKKIRKETAEGQKETTVSVPLRTLRISVGGKSGYNCDQAVRDFSERLRSSDVLDSKLQDVRVAKGGSRAHQFTDLVSYEIDCIFKPPL